MEKIYFVIIALLILSCNGSNNQELKSSETIKSCVYEYDAASTIVKWTAFKFTDKAGVGGTFNKVNVLISQSSENMFNTLNGATFTIPTNEINSANPERDQKIQDHFFGSMLSTEVISGNIKSIDQDSANIEITMNGVSVDYKGSVDTVANKIIFTNTINLNDFNAKESVDSLNAVCSVLHTGTDGVSKLWSEVDIVVETTLKKTCE